MSTTKNCVDQNLENQTDFPFHYLFLICSYEFFLVCFVLQWV